MGQHKTKTFEFPSIATADREKQSKRRFERYAVDCLAFVQAEGDEKSLRRLLPKGIPAHTGECRAESGDGGG